MGKSLYRSYRSTSFDEIIGQDHIVTTLKNALKKHEVSHAYLLSGPRGVGKTSVARILAYAVNQQDYSLESTNLDIIEIDAASNRRIDEIREIRERVHIAPVAGKYKVYIIDEVHMLTREAFNALLKTLEEPPAHAIFILATTEAHKVPETILSRCIKFTFKPIDEVVLAHHLKNIAKKEHISISNEALAVLAEHGRGSFRDAISLLEQVRHQAENIDITHVQQMLGLAPQDLIVNIIGAVSKSDLMQLKDALNQVFISGTSVAVLCSQLLNELRNLILQKDESTLQTATNIKLQEQLLLAPGSPQPKIALELALQRATLENVAQVVTASSSATQPKNTSSEPKPESLKKREKKAKPKATSKQIQRIPIETKGPVSNKPEPLSNASIDLWPTFLDALKKKNNTLYSIARMAEFTKQDDNIHLGFTYAFHEKQVKDNKNKAIFIHMLSEINGSPVTISTSLVEKKPSAVKEVAIDPLVSVSNIFGSHEVLES